MAPLTLLRIASKTGLNYRTARRQAARLVTARVLTKKTGESVEMLFGINKDYEAWKLKKSSDRKEGLRTPEGQLTSLNGVHGPSEQGVSEPSYKKKEEEEKQSFIFSGGHLRLTDIELSAFKKAFPRIDVEESVMKADAWCVANPDRAPRKRHARFMHSWLGRERPRDESRGIGNDRVAVAATLPAVGVADPRRQISPRGEERYRKALAGGIK